MSENKFKKFIRQNIGYFIVFVASAIYIVSGIIRISETGKSLSQIIVDGALAFFFGVFINSVMDLQGMINGDGDDRVVKTNKLHADTVEKVTPFIDKLDGWCDKKNKEELKKARTRILSREGLKYSEYFDEDGVSLGYETNEYYSIFNLLNKDKRQKCLRERAKYKAYKKACKVKLTLLSTSLLTSDGGKQYDPFYFGRTKADYARASTIKDSISKGGIAVISGIYGFELITNFSWSNLIWTSVQVVLFLLMGVIKMYRSMIFVTDEYRGRTIKKIDKLEQFYAEESKLLEEKSKTVAIVQNEPKTQEITQENINKGEENNGNL